MDTIVQQMADELAVWENQTRWSENRDDSDAQDEDRLGEPVYRPWTPPAAPYIAPENQAILDRMRRRRQPDRSGPEVWAISPVTGWTTQMPRPEAERLGLHHAETLAGLGPVSRTGQRLHAEPRVTLRGKKF